VHETSCRRACTAVQEKLGMCGNMAHALRTQGGPVVLVRRGRGGVLIRLKRIYNF
jgi:hypothetical protein